MYRPETRIFSCFVQSDPLNIGEAQRELALNQWIGSVSLCVWAIAEQLSPLTGLDVADLHALLAAQPDELYFELDSPAGWRELARAVAPDAADLLTITVH